MFLYLTVLLCASEPVTKDPGDSCDWWGCLTTDFTRNALKLCTAGESGLEDKLTVALLRQLSITDANTLSTL